MKKVAFETFGCKVNQYETACIAADFIRSGYSIVDFSEDADVYIINTCTVTNRTDYKSRNAIRKVLKRKASNPDIKLVVTGCYAQLNLQQINKMGDIDFIIDNNQKGEVIKCLKDEKESFQNIFNYDSFDEIQTDFMLGKSRAFLKIQDGCNFYCSYCTIPLARGKPRSRKPEKIIEQVNRLVASGYEEIVLGGINLGLYGVDLKGKWRLAEILNLIEKETDIKMIRLSSIEPQLFSDKLLKYFSDSKKICPHFHIPLQSGSDFILEKMKRRYRTADFTRTVKAIKNIFPYSALGFDVIVGFPGEDERRFNETYSYLFETAFTYLHVFSYSRRKNTPAFKMKGHVNGKIIKRRNRKLTSLSKQKKDFHIKMLLQNKIKLSGVNEKEVDGYFTALSDHFTRIYIAQNPKIKNGLIQGYPEARFCDGLLVRD